MPGDDPARASCSGNTASHSATRKPDCPGPGRPARNGILLRRPSWPDGTSRPPPAGQQGPRQIPGWLSAPCVRRAP
jgi:hypothetical protein